MNKRLPVTLVLAATLGGCAGGLSKEECQLADWHSIGFEDGARGVPQTQVSNHRKDCAEHGVAPQLSEYRQGWQAGIETYCQPGNAYSLGRKGKTYRGVCPDESEAAFLQAYGDGRELYVLEQEVRRLNSTIKRKHRRLDQIEVELRDAGLELVAEGVPVERRVVLVDTIRKLGEERADTQSQIGHLQAELVDKQTHLEHMSSARAY